MVCSEFSLIHFHTTDSSCEVFKGIRGKNYSLPKARNPTGVEETPDLVTPSEPNLRYPWLKVVEKMEEQEIAKLVAKETAKQAEIETRNKIKKIFTYSKIQMPRGRNVFCLFLHHHQTIFGSPRSRNMLRFMNKLLIYCTMLVRRSDIGFQEVFRLFTPLTFFT